MRVQERLSEVNQLGGRRPMERLSHRILKGLFFDLTIDQQVTTVWVESHLTEEMKANSCSE